MVESGKLRASGENRRSNRDGNATKKSSRDFERDIRLDYKFLSEDSYAKFNRKRGSDSKVLTQKWVSRVSLETPQSDYPKKKWGRKSVFTNQIEKSYHQLESANWGSGFPLGN